MDEFRLAQIERQTKSLHRRAEEQVIHCSDGVDRYGDEAQEILHATDVNIPDLIAEVRRLRERESELVQQWETHDCR